MSADTDYSSALKSARKALDDFRTEYVYDPEKPFTPDILDRFNTILDLYTSAVLKYQESVVKETKPRESIGAAPTSTAHASS
jgi:hypothetical protein